MYAYIKGILTGISEGAITVEAGGIGYILFVSNSTLSELPRLESQVKIYTYLHVKEDEMTLYGFNTEAEKHFFLKLIGVSGIGPKLALSILSGASLQNLSASIISGDTNTLSQIKGIGKKTAQRIVLELKESCGDDDTVVGLSSGATGEDTVITDSLEILEGMGAPRSECYDAVLKARAVTDDVTEIVRTVLLGMNK